MEWTQFIIMLIAIFGLFIWNRSESRSDYRHMETQVNTQITAIREEMKDFHTKLYVLEEKYFQMREERSKK